MYVKVEVKPAKIYSKPLEDVGEGDEEWSGEEEDAVEEVIIPGTDWESVNYVYKKFSCEVSIFCSLVLKHLPSKQSKINF